MRVHVLEHHPIEGIGTIADWIVLHGHEISRTRWYESTETPDPRDIDLLVVMGGPMGVHDETLHPWLGREKAFLDRCIEAEVWCLGVCLGAQLLADRLGGDVARNAWTEIGWWPVHRTLEGASDPIFRAFPERLDVFHWHGDTFAVPPHGAHCAYSQSCASQAFRKGRVVGIQFHLELSEESLGGLIEAQGSFDGPFIQEPDQFLADAERFRRLRKANLAFLDHLASEIGRA
ncbi:MAG: type 1 glutamine amidotransferase [Fibrobacteria bacterium]|nr:type 1 glutamine amidotransferase [Fibrobacteria bacterium]